MSIPDILRNYRTIAVVGLSNDETRPAYSVSQYMQNVGYRIIPVNPDVSEVLGEKAYPTVASTPEPVEIVNVSAAPRTSRRSSTTPSPRGRKSSGCSPASGTTQRPPKRGTPDSRS